MPPSSRIWPPWPAAITREARFEYGAEVVIAAQLRLARRDSHPNGQFQRPLRSDRRIDRRPRRGEHSTHPVTGVLEQ